jgi:molybdopterin molybdotransferase
MIALDEGLKIVLDSVKPLGTEEVAIADALRRTLAEDVLSADDVPCYDNSAMDGFAVIAADIASASEEKPVALDLCEDVPAGKIPEKEVRRGLASRIMTGAPIPRGADSVVMVEQTEAAGGKIQFLKPVEKGDNIRPAGEDLKKGDIVLRAGHVIRPQEMGLLSSAGCARVKVFRRPRVAILSTGDEIIESDQPLTVGKVRNSNAYTLTGLVLKCDAVPFRLGIVRDTKAALREKLVEGLQYDMIVSTGGVSVGDYDYVKDALTDLRWDLRFWGVATKPGKPVAFGLLEGKPVFGLPGNPSGAMVAFEQLVRPALLKMQGRERLSKPTLKARLEEDLWKKPGRMEFVSGIVVQREGVLYARPAGRRGSGVLSPLCRANAYIVMPGESSGAKKGEVVDVQILDAAEM